MRSARSATRPPPKFHRGEGEMPSPPTGAPPPNAKGREAEDAAWLDLAGRSGHSAQASPMYRMRISGPAPSGLIAIAKDYHPANRERGQSILEGKWRFGASTVETPP